MTDIQLPEPPGPTGTPSRPGTLARLMPLLTLVIAFSAIGLAIWEGLENRQHNRLTVKPRIGGEIDAGRDGEIEFLRVAIESTGLGPAVITGFNIYFDGVLQDTADAFGTGRWMAVGRALDTDHHAARMNAQGISEGYYLPPGRAMTVFEATRPQRPEGDTVAPLLTILDRLVIQICYCSVYGSDCDGVDLTTADTVIQQCPVR